MVSAGLLFIVDYLIVSFVLVVAAATFLQLNRMQSVYQKSLVRKVKNIKEKQNAYINEKNEEKLPKLEKKHAKAVKSLERRIKRVMFFNRNTIINNSILTDEANLALPGQEKFTFLSKLDELINNFNNKHKRRKTVNQTKKNKSNTITVTEETQTTLEPVEVIVDEVHASSLPLEEIAAERAPLETIVKDAKNSRPATSLFGEDNDERTF